MRSGAAVHCPISSQAAGTPSSQPRSRAPALLGHPARCNVTATPGNTTKKATGSEAVPAAEVKERWREVGSSLAPHPEEEPAEGHTPAPCSITQQLLPAAALGDNQTSVQFVPKSLFLTQTAAETGYFHSHKKPYLTCEMNMHQPDVP